jgi:hypothetical protein
MGNEVWLFIGVAIESSDRHEPNQQLLPKWLDLNEVSSHNQDDNNPGSWFCYDGKSGLKKSQLGRGRCFQSLGNYLRVVIETKSLTHKILSQKKIESSSVQFARSIA